MSATTAVTRLSPSADDIEFFARNAYITDPEIKQRIVVERAIVRRVVADILEAGYTLRLHDGEDWATSRTTDAGILMKELMATDEEKLVIYKGSEKARVGAVQLVYGNDGWDVISDYSDNEITNKLLSGANELAESLAAI